MFIQVGEVILICFIFLCSPLIYYYYFFSIWFALIAGYCTILSKIISYSLYMDKDHVTMTHNFGFWVHSGH